MKNRKTSVHISEISEKGFQDSKKEFNDISIFENNIKFKVYIKEALNKLSEDLEKDVIKLVAVEFEGEPNDPRCPILVSEFNDDIQWFIETYTSYTYDEKNQPEDVECMYVSDIFILPYDNYEEAYEDALQMREGAKNCYKETNGKSNESEFKIMDKVFGFAECDFDVPVMGIVHNVNFSCDITKKEPIGEFSYDITEEYSWEEIESTDEIESWYDVEVICKVQSFPDVLFVNIDNEKIYVNWYDELYNLLCDKVFEDDDITMEIAVKYKNGKFKHAGSIEEIISSVTKEMDYITIRLFDNPASLKTFINNQN